MTLKTKFRVGKIRYINCLPFYHGLENDEEWDFQEDVPAVLNAALREGKIDIAPVSSLEYLNNQSDYLLLPFIIGSRHFAGSVFLFSRDKIETLNGAKIAVTKESLSSAALLRIILKNFFKFENEFVETESKPEQMLQDFPAALVIGDDALYYEPKEFIYKYDLGEMWRKQTGLPFCYALWTVRRDFAQSNPEDITAFAAKLKTVLDQNLLDIELLLKNGKKMTLLDERFPKTFAYLFNLSYEFDEPMQQGLEQFFKYANQLQLSPAAQPLEFFQRKGTCLPAGRE